MMNNLSTDMVKGKVALVTGAAGALGLATSKALLADGMRVVIVDLNRDRLCQLAQDLPGDVYPIAVDISQISAVQDAYGQIKEEFGEVDVLVNNAGILSNNKLETTSSSEWQKVMGANLNGAFFWSQVVIPHMKSQRWGRIINTCSVASKSGGLTAGTAYTTSKGALTALTFSIARETAQYGITCNGISPAYVRSRMITEQLTEAQRQALLKQIPVGRFCEPEEFAHIVRFLTSPLAGFITGEIIDQNGGLIFD